MGPFPHDAPPAAITPENPMGTDGFAFVEFAHPEPLQLHRLFRLMGFAEVAKHRTKAITVYRQGDVDYLVNEEPNTQAARFAARHGPCAASMGFRVVDAAHAHRRALSLGAEPAGPGAGLASARGPGDQGDWRQPSLLSRSVRRERLSLRRRFRLAQRARCRSRNGGASIISII